MEDDKSLKLWAHLQKRKEEISALLSAYDMPGSRYTYRCYLVKVLHIYSTTMGQTINTMHIMH